MQIRNFSAAGLRAFGRTLASLPGEALFPCVLHRSFAAQSPVERCVCSGPVVLDYASGMSLLVLFGQAEPLFFYLDRIVQLEPGVEFAVAALSETCAVDIHLPSGDALRVVSAEPAAAFQPPASDLRLERLYTFFYQECSSDFYFRGEQHEAFELVYVDRGELHNLAGGADVLLRQQQLMLIGRNVWHMQYADIGVAPRYVTISFASRGNRLNALLNRKFTAPQKAVTLLQNMLREQETTDALSGDIILCQLNLLLLLLLRETTAPTGGKLQTANAVHSENEIIRQAQQFISSHIREKLSVPLVARQVDVSPSYLTALFHKNLQISPGEYIRRIKLQESKQMIRENNLNFTEIAAELQYSTVHHFSRQFKEKFGITPTEYAKSVR